MLTYVSKRWLQHFDFRKSQYLRPTQKWVCGWMAEGRACQLGPDAKGQCVVTHECRPMHSDDRWQCARSDNAGGRCSESPLPDGVCSHPVQRCVPVPSLRARRGLLARWLTALTIGSMLLLIGGAYGLGALSSGDLTTHHADISACGDCHTNFDKGPAYWLVSAFAENTEIADSGQCLNCHSFGDRPMTPHNQVPEALWDVKQKASPSSNPGSASAVVSMAAAVFKPGDNLSGPLTCRQCHQEHDGKERDITKMSNARCQACHQSRFASLGDGHPEFGIYPFDQRTKIIFDHVSHIGKHFKDAKVQSIAPQACRDCHSVDVTGLAMEVKGFDATCAACHAGQIEGESRAGPKGTPVLSVPGLDVETLRDLGVPIGYWPEDAEGEITPFMDFLLAGDKDYAAARVLLADGDLFDLDDADGARLEAVKTMAWAVKGLIADMEVEGMSGVKSRLEKALGHPLKREDLTRLTGLLPVDALRTARRLWFPGLLAEVHRHRQGVPVVIPNAADAEEEEDFDAAAKDEEDSESDDDDEILDDKAKDDDDGGILDDDDEEEDAKDDGDGKILDDDEEKMAAKPGAAPVVETKAMAAMPAAMPDEDWSLGGGWYRDGFSLVYQPPGHSDRFLRAWLDVAGGASGKSEEPEARQIFATLSAANAPGFCGKCHSVSVDDKRERKLNWNADIPNPARQRFTRFSHISHFSLLGQKGCLTCHEFDAEADYLSSFKNAQGADYASNFKPVERTLCATCHTGELAGDNCTSCHNYHVGQFPPAIANMPMIVDHEAPAKKE